MSGDRDHIEIHTDAMGDVTIYNAPDGTQWNIWQGPLTDDWYAQPLASQGPAQIHALSCAALFEHIANVFPGRSRKARAPDFDLSRLPGLLARLDAPVPCDGLGQSDEYEIRAERNDAAAAIRALMAEREVLPVDTIVSLDAVEEAAAELFSKYDEIADNTDWEELGDNTQNDYREVARGIIGTAVAAERETCAKVCEEVASSAVPVPRSDYWEGFWAGALPYDA